MNRTATIMPDAEDKENDDEDDGFYFDPVFYVRTMLLNKTMDVDALMTLELGAPSFKGNVDYFLFDVNFLCLFNLRFRKIKKKIFMINNFRN